jgi:hypothetical protein
MELPHIIFVLEANKEERKFFCILNNLGAERGFSPDES